MKTLTIRLLAVMALMLAGVGAASPASATFSGTDGLIVYVKSNQIYTIPPAGGTPKQLTTSTSGKNYRPEWSPDGSRIAYINETSSGVKDIWTMSATGTAKTKRTAIGQLTAGPTWSPDGARIALADGNRTLRWISSTASATTAPTPFYGYTTGNTWQEPETPAERHLLFIAGHPLGSNARIAWSAKNRIAFVGEYDAHLDLTLHHYNPATEESRVISATGGDCCGYQTYNDVFWGPTGSFGYSGFYEVYPGSEPPERTPQCVVYKTTPCRAGDIDGAPSPSTTNPRLVLTNSGRLYIQNLNGSGRKILTTGYQADWQSR